MSVIKFIDGEKKVGSGTKPSIKKIFSAELVYGEKENLPSSLSRNQFLITTDTHEIFRGNSSGAPELFNAIEIYDKLESFPQEAIESKMYLDRESGALFFFAGGQYRQVGAGEGVIVSPNSKDLRVGELTSLATNSKDSIVDAINEVIQNMPVVDFSGLATESFVEQKISEIQAVDVSNLATKEELANALSNAEPADISGLATKEELNNAIGAVLIPDVTGLASKQELAEALGKIEIPSVPSLDGYATESFVEEKIGKISIPSTESFASKSQVEGVQNELSALQETVNDLSVGDVEVDLAGYAKTADVYTKSQVDVLIPNVSGFAKTTDVYTKSQIDAKIPDTSGLAKATDVYKKAEVYTKSEVDSKIPNTSSFAKTADVYTKAQVDAKIPKIEGLATEAFVTSKIDAIEKVDTTGLATKEYVDSRVSNIVIDTTEFVRQEDIDASIAAINIPSITGLATEVQLDKKADKTAVEQLKAKVDGLVVISAADKQKYDAYEALVATLGSDLTSLIGRVNALELRPGGGSVDPVEPQEPNTPPAENGIEYVFDFILPAGTGEYDLAKDEKWKAAGHRFEPMEDVYGDIAFGREQKLFVYYAGTGANPLQEENYILLPRDGAEELIEQGNKGWSVYETEQIIIFQKSGLTDYRYRVVKYA